MSYLNQNSQVTPAQKEIGYLCHFPAVWVGVVTRCMVPLGTAAIQMCNNAEVTST